MTNLINRPQFEADLQVTLHPDATLGILSARFSNLDTPPGSALITVQQKWLRVGEEIIVELQLPDGSRIDCFGLVSSLIEHEDKLEADIFVENLSFPTQTKLAKLLLPA